MKVGAYTAFGGYTACQLCTSNLMFAFPIVFVIELVVSYLLKRPNYPCDRCGLFKGTFYDNGIVGDKK